MSATEITEITAHPVQAGVSPTDLLASQDAPTTVGKNGGAGDKGGSEKKVNEVAVELSRSSTLSTPGDAHRANPFDADVEAMIPPYGKLNRKSTTNLHSHNHNQDCSVWPGQEHWKQKARAAKLNNRNCQCMARLSQRNRVIAKLTIGVLVIGIAVAVGLGISKPLGAGIWQPKGQ